jgi:dipeptidyl aminopeptidase/acylaminoacyl peptidase
MVRTFSSGHHSVNSVAWAPHGTQLAAVMDSGDADQLYAIDPASGSEKQLTHGDTSVIDFDWSPRGDVLAFTRRESAPKRRGADAFRDAFEVTDNAYLVTKPALPAHLWVVTLAGDERRLTAGTWSIADAALSWGPRGDEILFERAPTAVRGLQDRTAAVGVDLRDGRLVNVTPHARYEDQALFSPDGSRIAYLYARNGDPANETDAMIVSRSGSDDTDVSFALDRHVATASWMPDGKSLLLSVHDSAAMPLYVQPLRGKAQRLALGDVVAASIEPQGSIAKDGTIVFAGSSPRDPDEVYVLAPNAASPRRITHYNDAIAGLRLGRAERITWLGPGRRLEDGVVTYPPGYRHSKRYPLVLRIHGGPTESSMTAFEPFYQLAAARGYVVFAPNYRGSNDLGNAYERAIFNDASAGPGADIMAGIRAVEKTAFIDPARIGVSGWSYGGQLTSWMEGHYHIWKAAVAGAAVNDLVVDYAIADDIDADAIAFSGGSPFRKGALTRWRSQSPITSFQNIRTPTLILCNVYDVRVPIVESYEMYHALRDNGVTVKFFAYPSAGHLPNGPVRLADAYGRWLEWFDTYLHPSEYR